MVGDLQSGGGELENSYSRPMSHRRLRASNMTSSMTLGFGKIKRRETERGERELETLECNLILGFGKTKKR